ncbi:MAG: cupredoxin domain-containing protein [bacterium]
MRRPSRRAPTRSGYRTKDRAPHDLSIKGPGVATAKSQVIDSGATSELTVALEPGTYQLWCSVDGHRAKGMDTTITVG